MLGDYGVTEASPEQLRQIKLKIEILKEALKEQRGQKQELQQQVKHHHEKYIGAQELLKKKEEKNELLLNESRHLKDLLISEKQEIKEMEAAIHGVSKSQNTANSWTDYLTGFMK